MTPWKLCSILLTSAAVIFFLLAAFIFPAQPNPSPRVNLVALGLGCLAGAELIDRTGLAHS